MSETVTGASSERIVSPEIVAKVNALMHDGFEIPTEKLTPSATLFDQLGLDSLDVVDMLVHLEESMRVKVDAKLLVDVRTLQDVYNLVAAISAEGAAVSSSVQAALNISSAQAIASASATAEPANA